MPNPLRLCEREGCGHRFQDHHKDHYSRGDSCKDFRCECLAFYIEEYENTPPGTRPKTKHRPIKCPECGSELVERMSKKKRTFYGCSNYPKCTFATNRRPLSQPCPQCGGLLTLDRQKWKKCVKCDYKEKLEGTETKNHAD